MMKTKKVHTIGKEQFLLPYIAQGFCVCDKTGRVVMEAKSHEIAKDVVKMLNQEAQK